MSFPHHSLFCLSYPIGQQNFSPNPFLYKPTGRGTLVPLQAGYGAGYVLTAQRFIRRALGLAGRFP